MRNHEKPRQGRQNGLQREFPYAASRLRLLLPQPTADAAGFLLQLLRSYLPPLSKTDLARRRFIGRKWFDNAAAFLLTTHGTPEFYARTTLAAHHPRRADHVHDFIRGPNQRGAGVGFDHFDHDEGPSHGRQNERRSGGYFLSGLRALSDSGRAPGPPLEREKVDRHSARAMGDLRGGLRSGDDGRPVQVHALSARGGRERRISRHARAVGTVVSTARTRARECVLESVPATGRGGVRSVDGLAARPMGLANDADRGGHPALSLAAPLAFVH